MKRKTDIRKESEPTIALINIVFLMLIFFMVAGTLAAPIDPALKLVQTHGLDGTEPANVLVITSDGNLSNRGQPVTDVAAFFAEASGESKTARLMPDQNAPASRVIELARLLRQSGAQKVVILSEKALQ
jgi:biopolymer transport protein ExbD